MFPPGKEAIEIMARQFLESRKQRLQQQRPRRNGAFDPTDDGPAGLSERKRHPSPVKGLGRLAEPDGEGGIFFVFGEKVIGRVEIGLLVILGDIYARLVVVVRQFEHDAGSRRSSKDRWMDGWIEGRKEGWMDG